MSQKTPNTASSRYLNFSNDEDSNLIDIVEQNRALYDIYEKDHKDMLVRNQLWLDVARQMGRNVSECKKRWRSMKDTYFRQKRNKNKSNWILMKRLQFLDYIGRNCDGLAEATSDQHDDNSITKEEVMHLVDDTVGVQPNTTSSKSSGLKVYHYLDDLDPYDPDSASESKNKPLQTEHVIKLIEQCNRERHGEDFLSDPIFAFFHSMALAVKKLPPELIAEARVSICTIVGNLEVKAFRCNAQEECIPDRIVKMEMTQEQIFEADI